MTQGTPTDETTTAPRPRWTKAEDGRVIVALSKPIPWGSEAVRELRLRELKDGDLRSMPVDEKQITVGHMLDLISVLSGQSPALIAELSVRDLGEVSALVDSFQNGVADQLG